MILTNMNLLLKTGLNLKTPEDCLKSAENNSHASIQMIGFCDMFQDEPPDVSELEETEILIVTYDDGIIRIEATYYFLENGKGWDGEKPIISMKKYQ